MAAALLSRIAASIAALAFLTLSAMAGEPETFTGSIDGVAINGYDPVAYFRQKAPVRGSAEFTTQWKGVNWRFASQENLDLFEAEPERYAPQYGGYCAWAVSQGYTAKTDPRAFSLIDGKLYLNYSRGVQATWAKDLAGNISRGDANWPKVLE